MGGVTALPSTLPNPSYLQIQVQSETLSPRLQFGSVPFAQQAETSAMLQRARTFGYQESGIDNGLVPERSVSINNQQTNSYLRVSYHDNFRIKPVGSGAYGKWEVLFNGQSCSNPGPIIQFLHNENGGFLARGDTIVGYCRAANGLPFGAGQVTLTVSVNANPFGLGNSDLFTGGGPTQFVLEAEEAL